MLTNNHIADTAKNGLLAAGGILGAAGAAACCLLPLVFALIGISGAWIGSLTRLAPYQPVFVAIAGLSIGSGLWRVYGKRQDCDATQCGTLASRRFTKIVLWFAAALAGVASTTGWWVQWLG
jgi:mercuric ion transport protein